MKESTRREKEARQEVIDSELREFFIEHILRNKKVPNLELCEDKDFNLNSFLKCLENKYNKNFEDLIWAIYKTYIDYKDAKTVDVQKENETNKFLGISASDLISDKFSRQKALKLFGKFMEDYLYKEGEEQFSNFGKMEDCMVALYGLLEDRLTERMGNIVYFNFNKYSHNSFMAKFRSFLDKSGYVIFPTLPDIIFDPRTDFMAMPNRQQNLNVNVQEYLAKAYVEFGKKIALYYREEANGKNSVLRKKDVARDWEILKQAKINFENLLSEEMLKREDVKHVIENTNYLLSNEEKRIFIERTTYEGQHGDYYVLVQDALKNPHNEESKRVIKNFIADMKKVVESLKYRDEEGRCYPVNYFKIIRNSPVDTYTLINSCKGIVSSEDESFLEEARQLMKWSFGELNNSKQGIKNYVPAEKGNCVLVQDVQRLLGLDKMTSYNGLSQEQLVTMPSKVEKIMQKEDLPYNLTCIKLVYQACLNDVPAVKMPPSLIEKGEIVK